MAPPKKDASPEVPLDLTMLINRKQRIFEQIQSIFDMSQNISDSDSKELFLLNASEVDNLRKTFERITFKILELELETDPKATLRSHELNSLDELYFRIKLSASKIKPKANDVKVENSSSTKDVRPRLPKLDLFVFGGDIENFTTFYETFGSLVHNQTSIEKIDKFHYLLSCTRGAALNIVKSVPITTDNYDVVWQSLLDKYKDSRMLVGRYLDKMLNFSPLNKESSNLLNTFIEHFDHSYKAIQALNIDDLGSYILCHIALKALDPQTRKLFEQQLNQKSIPKFSELMLFIHNHVKVLEHSASYSNTNEVQKTKSIKIDNNNIKQYSNRYERKPVAKNISHASASRATPICAHCEDSHMIYRCDQFRKLTAERRMDRADSLKLCRNCLKSNHSLNECNSQYRCVVCQSNHHYLLHTDATDKKHVFSAPSVCPPAPPLSDALNNCHASTLQTYNNVVILGTAVVHVKDRFNCYQSCRVLIDSGAQSNFISIDCLQRLGLSQRKCPFNIFGLSGESVKNYGMVSCNIKSRHCDNPIFNIDAVVLRKITCDLPTVKIPDAVVSEYKNLLLADPNFYKKSPIDIILAGDIFPYVYDGKKIVFATDVPPALSSVFGYIITGKLGFLTPSDNNINVVASTTSLVSYTTEENLLNDTLKRFWELESLPCEASISPLEELAEKIYSEKHYRNETGRYVSPILLNPNHDPLGESYEMAMRRLIQVERRLARSPELQNAYRDFMREYESLGHMEVYKGSKPSKFLIPHHCVLRPSSTTTPLRVVFDGSAKTSTGSSLNDALLTGQKLLQDVLTIIINFRLFEVCLTADVSKMYRAVLIDPSEREYQHILWRDHPTHPVQIYELKTNTYGLRSAPFIAIRTLHQLAHDEKSRAQEVCSQASPEVIPAQPPRLNAAQVLVEGFYVDDLLWSCQSSSEACTLQDDLMSLLKSGGFELRKWASNDPSLLSRMQSDQVSAINFKDDTLSSSLKVLGLTWLPSGDSFSFNYNMRDVTSTKRSVLKLLASIFDPVGFISPCTFLAKCIMQDLWKLGLGWDEKLPTELYKKWTKFISDLPILSELRIERHLLLPKFTQVHLIAFCDASSRGYASCVYLRSVDSAGTVKVRLLTSKSKVAPTKPVLSIPRLELMAAVLLIKLVKFVVKHINRIQFQTTAFSDSSVVLSWIQTPPYKLKPFVANRVSQISDVVPPNCWLHINSSNNAADLCSRGALPSQFNTVAEQWFHGPAWLYENPELWPTSTFFVKDETKMPELKSNVDSFTFNSCDQQEFKNDLENTFNKFSSFNRLQRVIAWCYRFVNNSRAKVKRSPSSSGPLRTSELTQAHNIIITCVQTNHFSSEMQLLQNKRKVASLRKLSPFIDTQGFLRVGGRIVQSELPYGTKHPVLLPKKIHVTQLIINYFHKIYLHVGPRTLQGILCRNYWIVNARNTIRSVLSKCSVCFKCRPMVSQPAMGTLPAARLKPDKVFNHVGCDIGGPFLVKESLQRKTRIHKSYLCLFIYFATKAVHLEVITDLSCECFLAAFDRFVARRGLCSCLYSDCGTNFVAAAKHLKEVCNFFNDTENKDNILDGLSSRRVDWRTNPPNAASMGGLWVAYGRLVSNRPSITCIAL